jgi:hypothetical protein
MYEVATFTSLQPIDKLHLIAVAEIPALAAMWLFHALATVGILYVGSVLLFSRWFSLLCNEYAPDPVAQVAVVMVGSTCVLACCYGCVCWFVYDKLVEHIRAAQVLKRQLSSFAISDLQCAVESDRVVVEKQIKDLFGTLDKFEALVREKVEPALSKSTVAGWPWWMIILAVSPHAWIGFPQPLGVGLRGDLAFPLDAHQRHLHGRRARDVRDGSHRSQAQRHADEP